MHRLTWGFADPTHLIVGNLMSRLNYIISRHWTQSQTFAYMINSAPDLVWQDVGDLLHLNYLQTLKAGGRERERLVLAYESLVISKNFMYRCWKWYLEMPLVRIGFCTTKSDIRQYWCFACFLSHAQMFKLMKHYFLNSIRIWSGSELWQRFFPFFFKGERIQISLKVGHHRPASEAPLNGVSLACRWWPNVEWWLGSFENFRGSGSVLLRKSIFLWFSRGGGGGPDLLSPLWIRAWDRTMYTLIEIYWKSILSCASAFVRHFAYFLSHQAQIIKLKKHSFLNSIGSDLDPNCFCKFK